MPRDRKSRDWIKINCTALLNSSINYTMQIDERAAWLYLIAFSEICGVRAGYIEDNNGRAMPPEYVAGRCNIPLDIYLSMVEKQTKEGAIETNGDGVMHLVNFDKYQFTEYDRQKPYREAKKEEKVKKKKAQYGHLLRQ